ncbi:MAG: hypothetical protein M3R13_09695 [Armatimonadota bacterium]|nr:hypothetical protein [Armatimonadota bacterium]
MSRLILVTVTLCCVVSCNSPDFDQEIVGLWENAGTPSSTSLPEAARRSASWTATIEFKPDGSLEWNVDNGAGSSDRFTGEYSVVGYSLSIEVTSKNGLPLAGGDSMKYTVRQQSTGSIRLPLPQDWTGPSVDYFRER